MQAVPYGGERIYLIACTFWVSSESTQCCSLSVTMWTSLITTSAILALAAGVCKKYEKEYYKEIGCKPAKMGSDGCPLSYDCSTINQRASSKCHFKGKEYEQGFQLKETEDVCIVECRCAGSFPDNKMSFTCVNIECPELFIGPPPPGCYRTYENGKCCHVDQICLSDQSPEQKAARPVCKYNNQQFQIGQKFYPEDEPCFQCICQAGFNGTLVEPFCKKVNCNLELHYGGRIAEGCVPVYYGDNDCCPIGWRCPEKSDSVVSGVTAKGSSQAPNSELQCQFGDVKMQVGDKLSASRDWPNTECLCRVPPHCTQFVTNNCHFTELQCQFGDVKMQVGDKLSASRDWPNTECLCRVPPHCTQFVTNHCHFTELQCQFGDVKMQVGDKLSASRDWPNTECLCRVPPHCTQFVTNHCHFTELQCQFGDVKMQVGDKLSASRDWPNTECPCRVPPHCTQFVTNH
ncbi:kielin/chordin-like protein [Macrosteles quadrilineatus]|uniref:kielin/chordin-like protein n=1 Tax=Macrosteles quadrilineatus TaxID=74068 RepID=UPI0023E14189|nr:kielin/chordin-like protein [Macrosteles quadrilineatus]